MDIIDGISALKVVVRQIIFIKLQKSIIVSSEFKMWFPYYKCLHHNEYSFNFPPFAWWCSAIVSDDSDIGLVLGDSFGVDFGLSLTITRGNISALLPEETNEWKWPPNLSPFRAKSPSASLPFSIGISFAMVLRRLCSVDAKCWRLEMFNNGY